MTMAQLLRASVLGNSLGALRHGVLGQLSRQKETDSSLDLPRSYGRPLVVMRQLASLRCDPLEQVVEERVHDGHCLGRDPSVRVNLLQHLVDVDSIRLSPLLPLLFVCLGSFATLGSGLSGSLGRHP